MGRQTVLLPNSEPTRFFCLRDFKQRSGSRRYCLNCSPTKILPNAPPSHNLLCPNRLLLPRGVRRDKQAEAVTAAETRPRGECGRRHAVTLGPRRAQSSPPALTRGPEVCHRPEPRAARLLCYQEATCFQLVALKVRGSHAVVRLTPPSSRPETPTAETGILSPVLSFPKAEYFGSAGASWISPLTTCPVKGGQVMLGRTGRRAGRTPAYAHSHALRKHPDEAASYLYF